MPVSGASDQLLNVLTELAAVCAILAFLGGLVVGFLYSRKAIATVSAEVHATDEGTVVAVRPSVKALGPFTFRFKDEDGAVAQVTPMLATEKGADPDDENAIKRNAFPYDEEDNPQSVAPGETLTSSLIFRVEPFTPRLLGWLVSLNVASKGFIRHGLYWADRVFVPIAFPPTTKGGPNGRSEEEAHTPTSTPVPSEAPDSGDERGR